MSISGRSHHSSYVSQGSYRERSRSGLNGSEDRLDFSQASRATDREQSIPDYNLVEMFARCKLDPSFVSNSSISDILFNQTMKQNTPGSRHGKYSLSPENSNGRTLLEQNKSESDISCSNWNHTKTSDSSSKSLIYSVKSTPDRQMANEGGPVSISPLDPSRLWEESKGRLRLTPTYNSFQYPTGSDPSLNQPGERNTVLTVTPDTSRGITHLSLSYSDLNSENSESKVNRSGDKQNSALSETADSFVFRNGVNKSIESLSNSSNLVTQSELLSFSDVSLQLPDSSSSSRNMSQCTSAENKSYSARKNRSDEKYAKVGSLDRRDKSRSVDSFSSREYSPSERQSSYLSDRGLASSDRGLSSSSSTNNASGHRSLTSSGFQSEESNMSATSPAYGHFCSQSANQYQSTPIVENEISSINPPLSSKPLMTKRISLDKDIYPDVSKYKNSTPVIEENTTPVLQQAFKENITPVTSSVCKKPQSSLPPSSLFYSQQGDVDSPVLPPLGWSRRSSSAGSSGSGGRYFKDPSVDEYESANENRSDEDLKYSQSLVSQGSSNNLYGEKSSLSALLSDMSSSKCTRTSDETISLSSDPESLRRSSQAILSASMMKKAESLPYMPEHSAGYMENLRTGMTASLPYHRQSLDRSQNSIHDYENINNYSAQNASGSNSSSLNLSGGKVVSSYLCNNEPEKQRLQELYDELSHVSTLKKDRVPDYENVNERNDCNTVNNGMFQRANWRASLDKEMKDRLVHDIEKLAPKKLYQLRTKNGPPRKKLSPVDISEYTESPYKFRKSNTQTSDYENVDSLCRTALTEYTHSSFKVRKPGNSVRRTVIDSLRSGSQDSLTGECENIDSVPENANYVNIDHLLGPCPVATPESLSDTVILDDRNKTYSLISCENVEQNQDTCSTSLELLRNKSPINTSGVNSAFKPVKSRKSDESQLSGSSGDSDAVFSVNNEINELPCEAGFVEKSISSLRSGKSLRRQSNESNYLSDAESMSSFQWSQNSGSMSMTSTSDSVRHSPRNYLQLVGKAPLNFSVPTFLKDDNSSQISKHSYTDSIPWEESESLQTTGDQSSIKPTPRQPLKALENTPVFSPIYGLDRRLSIELSSRKRFMSTPKLSAGSEMSVSQTSDDSMAISGIKTPQRRRSSGIFKKTYSDNTSTWSTQSESDISTHVNEHSTFALSKTTYI